MYIQSDLIVYLVTVSFDDIVYPVLVDIYHKEQLVTKGEAEEAASADWRWGKLAVTKDSVSATRIADILDKYGFNNVARRIRGICVYSTYVVMYVNVFL